jgi:hypothetical protein
MARTSGARSKPPSDELEEWLKGGGRRRIGDLLGKFGTRSFAVLFVVLMALPAVPAPTGAVSHALEVVTMLLALELIAGRTEVWLPERWKKKELPGSSKFTTRLLKILRWLERFSRPRLSGLLERRVAHVLFGVIVLGLSLTAFLAPPFSGLDTLPALGVVVISVGMLLGDGLLAGVGLLLGAVGVGLVIGVGKAIGRLV